MRISDWSSDVCSSDLDGLAGERQFEAAAQRVAVDQRDGVCGGVQARVQQVDAVDAFGGVAQQAVAVARADQLREQVEVATEVEHVRIRREHDVGQVRFRLRRFAGDAVDRFLREQPQFAQQPGREAGPVVRVGKGLLPVHETPVRIVRRVVRSEEHTSELQSLMRISYAVFCLKKKTYNNTSYTTEK